VGTDASEPGVSIVIPTFQRRELVLEAIASVEAQSYRDFELIVIDDGSTDGTGEMVESLGGWDGRLRYRWQPHRGASAARNAGLRLARGEIVAFLDADNLWRPQHLERVMELFARAPEAVAVSTCSGFDLLTCQSCERAMLVDRDRLVFTGGHLGFISCTAARRDVVSASGGFDERLHALEDTDLWMRLALRGPYLTMRARTVVRRRQRDSLSGASQKSGGYLRAAEISAANLVSAATDLEGAASARVRQARGLLHLARAVSAVDRGDERAVQAELEASCPLLPELSSDPVQIHWRLREHARRSDILSERVRMVAALAELWPQQDSPTAHYLRAWAIGLSLRALHPWRASCLSAGWRPAGTGGFADYVLTRLRGDMRRRRMRRAENQIAMG
jgi:Glycosyl transferase family 2